MRALQITAFVLAIIAFTTQAIRHVHLLVFRGEKSVLAQFKKFAPVEQEIQAEKSFDLLVEQYSKLKTELDELEKGKTDESELKQLRKEHVEKYNRFRELEYEIKGREERTRENRDLWIFSGSGFVLVLLGAFLYRRNRPNLVWIGMALILAGYTEILYWSSPSFSGGGAKEEYLQLLINKIVFTLLGLGMLLALWILDRAKENSTP